MRSPFGVWSGVHLGCWSGRGETSLPVSLAELQSWASLLEAGTLPALQSAASVPEL